MKRPWINALLEFAVRVECLPIAIVIGADMLRRELDLYVGCGNEVHDVAGLLRRAIASRLRTRAAAQCHGR